jgi:hypothetical protein
VQLRAGFSEWVNPASARNPDTGLRMERASVWKIWKGKGYAQYAPRNCLYGSFFTLPVGVIQNIYTKNQELPILIPASTVGSELASPG